jgi:hypothetical protein
MNSEHNNPSTDDRSLRESGWHKAVAPPKAATRPAGAPRKLAAETATPPAPTKDNTSDE